MLYIRLHLNNMNKLRLAILFGLQNFGRNKTFSAILKDAGIRHSKQQILEAANELETLGLIQSITYQFPIEITAELTSYGKELLGSQQNEAFRKEHFHQNRDRG